MGSENLFYTNRAARRFSGSPDSLEGEAIVGEVGEEGEV